MKKINRTISIDENLADAAKELREKHRVQLSSICSTAIRQSAKKHGVKIKS